MDTAFERRTLFVMLGIMACQVWGLSAMLGGLPLSRILSFFQYRDAAEIGWALGGGAALTYVVASAVSVPYLRQRFWDITPLKMLAIPFALGAGALEELVFRRVLMDSLAHAGYAPALQLAASALAFGAAHGVFGLFSRSWRGVLQPVIWTTVLGAALGAIYLADGRDIAPCIWSHALIDLCIEPWLLIGLMRLHAPNREVAAA
jgi:hypothetical protein